MNYSVLAEPTFVFLSNPMQMYHSMQISFFGKKEIFNLHQQVSFIHPQHNLSKPQEKRVINVSGNPMQRTNFTLDVNTEAYFGCSVVYNGETLVLGGQKEPNQVYFCFYRLKINYLLNSSVKLNLVD